MNIILAKVSLPFMPFTEYAIDHAGETYEKVTLSKFLNVFFTLPITWVVLIFGTIALSFAFILRHAHIAKEKMTSTEAGTFVYIVKYADDKTFESFIESLTENKEIDDRKIETIRLCREAREKAKERFSLIRFLSV